MMALSASVPKYALVEKERRFLVHANVHRELSALPFRRIEDIYFEKTRLRLRKVATPDGTVEGYKLCKKYDPLSAGATPITSIYLTREEHERLAVLGGRALVKRRFDVKHLGRTFAVDVFDGELARLILAETEAVDSERVERPPWILREVTADRRFTGGELSRMSASELSLILARESA